MVDLQHHLHLSPKGEPASYAKLEPKNNGTKSVVRGSFKLVEIAPQRVFICEECHRWLLSAGRGHRRNCAWVKRLRAYLRRANRAQDRCRMGSSDVLGKTPSSGGGVE